MSGRLSAVMVIAEVLGRLGGCKAWQQERRSQEKLKMLKGDVREEVAVVVVVIKGRGFVTAGFFGGSNRS